MKKNNVIFMMISLIVCLLPMVAGVILYDRLPNVLPIRFKTNNMPDTFVSKNVALFGIPVIMAIFQIIVCTTIWFKKEKMGGLPIFVKILECMIPVITVSVYYVIIAFFV